jgi:hypothetical protein
MFLNYGLHEIADREGGYGDPLMRPMEKALKDVRNGIVSVGITKEHGVDHDPVFFNVHEEGSRKREETQSKPVGYASKY